MSFLYPRIIDIHRSIAPTGAGAREYSGVLEVNEAVIATGLPASIQLKSTRYTKIVVNLPANASVSYGWHIFIPRRSAALGLILARDVVIDDKGLRYVVFGPYWNSLGFNLLVELEQT